MRKSIITIISFCCSLLCVTSTDANAFQTHGNPEGLYVHQAAHLFFAASCLLLYGQLKKNRFLDMDGWHSIGNGILWLILWNLWTITGHIIEELLPDANITIDLHHTPVIYLDSWVAWAYIVLKCDHLLCVPGMYLIYKGIKKIAVSPELIPRFPL